jgi:hypothetical protein
MILYKYFNTYFDAPLSDGNYYHRCFSLLARVIFLTLVFEKALRVICDAKSCCIIMGIRASCTGQITESRGVLSQYLPHHFALRRFYYLCKVDTLVSTFGTTLVI